MATDVEITDPQLSIYVAVPSAGQPGACPVCHGAMLARDDGSYWPTCWNCRAVPEGGVRTIVPISLVHTSDSQLYVAARDYKADWVDDAVRGRHALLLAATLQRFLREHRHCIAAAAGDWDVTAVVPSTRGRVPHPLDEVVGRAPSLAEHHERLLTWTGQEISRSEASPDAFAATRRMHGERVLLLDDTMTSGSKLQSAALTLAAAGATVVAAVPVGRVVDTHDRPEKLAFWQTQRARRFSFAHCCLEQGDEPPT